MNNKHIPKKYPPQENINVQLNNENKESRINGPIVKYPI